MSNDILQKAEALIENLVEIQDDREYEYEIELIRALVAEIKRLQESNRYWEDEAYAMTRAKLVFESENSRLKADNEFTYRQLTAKDAIIADEVARRKALGEMCEQKDIKLAKWQEIARDERAQRIQDAQSGDFVNTQGDHIFQIADLDECREQAAKELGIQISQEASYLKRLEAEYIEMVFSATGSDEEAQAALDKIKGGK